MVDWMKTTKQKIQGLKKENFFQNWQLHKTDFLNFHLYPDIQIPDGWIEKRVELYGMNAEKLQVKPVIGDFFVFLPPTK